MEHDAAEPEVIEVSAGVELAVVGTATPFETFYSANARRLTTALCLMTANRHEAEEIAQEAFVRVYERWSHVRDLADPTGYVFRVALNVYRSRYRRTALAVRRALTLAPAATDDLEKVDARDALLRLLQELDPHQRAAVVLTGILEFSAEEAGELLAMKPSSVRSLTTRARAQLRQGGDPRES